MPTTIGAETSFTFTTLRSATSNTWDQSDAITVTDSVTDALLINAAVVGVSTAQSSANIYVDFYLSMGPDTVKMSGGWSGGDAAYAGDSLTGPPSLRFLGRVPYGDSADSATIFDKTFTVPGPIAPKVAIVSHNASSIALSASTTVQVTYNTVEYSS